MDQTFLVGLEVQAEFLKKGKVVSQDKALIKTKNNALRNSSLKRMKVVPMRNPMLVANRTQKRKARKSSQTI